MWGSETTKESSSTLKGGEDNLIFRLGKHHSGPSNYNLLLSKMNQLGKDRLLRLQRAAAAGELIRAKQGVFETNSCSVCGFHHKVSLLLENQLPCPGTEVGLKYYASHKEDRALLESFLLNKGLRVGKTCTREAAIEMMLPKITKSRKVTPEAEKELSTSRRVKPPGVNRSKSPTGLHSKAPVKATSLRSTSPVEGPKDSRGRSMNTGVLPQTHQLNRKVATSKHKKDGPQSGTPIGNTAGSSALPITDSDFKDPGPEGNGRDADTLKRQIMREMYSQEEAALRLRLAKEKERHKLNMNLLKSLDKQKTLSEIRDRKILEYLKKRLCALMEEEIILGVTKVTLDGYYSEYITHTRGVAKQRSKEGSQEAAEAKKQKTIAESQKQARGLLRPPESRIQLKPEKARGFLRARILPKGKWTGLKHVSSDATVPKSSQRGGPVEWEEVKDEDDQDPSRRRRKGTILSPWHPNQRPGASSSQPNFSTGASQYQASEAQTSVAQKIASSLNSDQYQHEQFQSPSQNFEFDASTLDQISSVFPQHHLQSYPMATTLQEQAVLFLREGDVSPKSEDSAIKSRLPQAQPIAQSPQKQRFKSKPPTMPKVHSCINSTEVKRIRSSPSPCYTPNVQLFPPPKAMQHIKPGSTPPLLHQVQSSPNQYLSLTKGTRSYGQVQSTPKATRSIMKSETKGRVADKPVTQSVTSMRSVPSSHSSIREVVFSPKTPISPEPKLSPKTSLEQEQSVLRWPSKKGKVQTRFGLSSSTPSVAPSSGRTVLAFMNKAVQTSPVQSRIGETCLSKSSSHDMVKIPMRRITGPMLVSPRPTSAHPLRRPDLNYEETASYVEDVVMTPEESKPDPALSMLMSHSSERSVSAMSSPADAMFHSYQIESALADHQSRMEQEATLAEVPASGCEDEVTTSGIETSNESMHSRSVSFVVNMQCAHAGEVKSDKKKSAIAVSSSKSLAGRKSSHQQVQASASASQEMIARTRMDSSIVSHVDSLIIMEHSAAPETHPTDAKQSKETIARARRRSSIMRHVDSLTLLENAKFKDHEGSNVSLHSPDRGSEEEDVSEESDQKPAGGVCSDIGFDSATDLRTADSSTLLRYRRGMTAPPPSPADGPGKPVKKTIGFNIATDPPHKQNSLASVRMADIQNELRQLEEDVYPMRQFSEDFDSLIVPAIFVSPCNSETEVIPDDPETIQRKSRGVAKYILLKAINMHRNSTKSSDSNESGFSLGLSPSESLIFEQTKDIVLEVIERALEMNLMDTLCSDNPVDTVLNSEAVIAIFDAVDPEKGMTPMQSQIFFRAKEMVHDAVSRALRITSGVAAMNLALNLESGSSSSDSDFKRIESERIMSKVEDIVQKVVRKAMMYFLNMMESRTSYAAASEVETTHQPKVYEAKSSYLKKKGLSKAKSEPTAKHREGSGCSSDSEESIDQGKPARKSDTAILSHKVDAGEEVSEDSDVGGDSINIISRRMAKRSLTMKAKESTGKIKTDGPRAEESAKDQQQISSESLKENDSLLPTGVKRVDSAEGDDEQVPGMRLYREHHHDSEKKLKQGNALLASALSDNEEAKADTGTEFGGTGDAARVKYGSTVQGGGASSEPTLNSEGEIIDDHSDTGLNQSSAPSHLGMKAVAREIETEGETRGAASGAALSEGRSAEPHLSVGMKRSKDLKTTLNTSSQQVGAVSDSALNEEAESDDDPLHRVSAPSHLGVKARARRGATTETIDKTGDTVSGTALDSTSTESQVRLAESQLLVDRQKRERESGTPLERFEKLLASAEQAELDDTQGKRRKYFGLSPDKRRASLFYSHPSLSGRGSSILSIERISISENVLRKMRGAEFEASAPEMRAKATKGVAESTGLEDEIGGTASSVRIGSAAETVTSAKSKHRASSHLSLSRRGSQLPDLELETRGAASSAHNSASTLQQHKSVETTAEGVVSLDSLPKLIAEGAHDSMQKVRESSAKSAISQGEEKAAGDKLQQFEELLAKANTPEIVVKKESTSSSITSVASVPVRGRYARRSRIANLKKLDQERGKFFGITPVRFRALNFKAGKTTLELQTPSNSKDASEMDLNRRSIRNINWLKNEPQIDLPIQPEPEKKHRTSFGFLCCSGTESPPTPSESETEVTTDRIIPVVVSP